MSGPSGAQLQLQQEQMDFYQQGMQMAQERYGDQESLLKQMESVYNPILQKGPDQEGYSEEEKANLDAEATEATATNYSRAAKAVGSQMATEGGGDNPLPSGADQQVRGEIASSAASELSREESQILDQSYTAGRENFREAGAALSTVAGQFDPTAFESNATSAGSSAETTAKDINSEENSWIAPVLGAIGGVAGDVIDQNPGNIFGK